MGNGFFSPPPQVDTTLPDIPVPNFQSTGQQVADGIAKSVLGDNWVAKLLGGIMDALHLALRIIGTIAQALASDLVAMWDALEAVNSPGFFALIGAILSQQLATDVNENQLQAAFKRGGNIGGLRSVGSAFYDNMISILQGGGATVTGAASDIPARQFMGFLIEYAIRSANTEVITQLLPEEVRFGEGFKAYGDNLEKTLALGRLARRAFQPLIQIAVADPLTRQLNSQYTPKQLSEAQYVRAFVRGDIDAAALQQNLAELGYNPTLQSVLIAENTKALTVRELLDFSRVSGSGSATPTGAMQQLGYSPSNADAVWQSSIESLVDPLRKQFLNELTNELRKGEIDLPTATNLLNSTSLFPQESAWYQQIWTQMLSQPRKRLSESQVEKAFLDGVIDMGSVQNYWQQSGYSFTDIQTLTALLLLRLQGGTKTRTGHTGRKHLTEAEIQKAVKEGVISLAQAQAYWTGMGYGPVDVEILTALYGGTSPGTPPVVSGTPV